MSVINKTPFIKTVLSSLTDEQLATLSTMIDGGGSQTKLNRTMETNTIGSATNITVSDKGVNRCVLTANNSLFNGYLLYSNSYCVLIHFTDSQVLGIIDIDVDTLLDWRVINEYLDINELRSELDDLIESGTSEAWANELSEHIEINSDGKVEVSDDLVVGGDVNVGNSEDTKDLYVSGNLEVDGSIEQDQPSYELDLTEALRNTANYSTYFKSDTFYCAFKVINGILWFVISGTAVTQTRSNEAKQFDLTIPDDFKTKYYDKIYKSDGKKMSEQSTGSGLWSYITGTTGMRSITGVGGSSQLAVLSAVGTSANSDIRLALFSAGATTEDNEAFYDIRIPILLI